MEVIDKNYWEKRWENNETGWDAGTITTPLKEYFDLHFVLKRKF